MSGGFFRGTSADQDTRFSNKQAKLMKTLKFAPELEQLVDMTKVKMDVMKPWIATRVTELLGFEDEVLINFIYGLLDRKEVNGKEVQISLTGFMEKNTVKFMKELWTLLLSAQKNASGVPQQFLDAKEEETRKKMAETDHIADEIRRKRDKESRELGHEKLKMMDSHDQAKNANADVELSSEQLASRASNARSDERKDMGKRNGVRGRDRRSRSRSTSKSFSNPRSHSDERRQRSRSISRSPRTRDRSAPSEMIHRSRKRSLTPHRRYSPHESRSPPRRRSSYYRRRSRSRSVSVRRRNIRSPIKHRSRSPIRRRSVTPVHRRRSPSPVRRRSPSPRRRRSPLPRRRRSPPPRRQRSPSPRRRRSPSLRRRRSPSLKRLGSPPIRRNSPSPMAHESPLSRSPSLVGHQSSSQIGQRSSSPMRQQSTVAVRHRSPSPLWRKSQSPMRHRLWSPVRHRSPSPMQDRSVSPVRHRSPSPLRRQEHRSRSAPRQRSPPEARGRSPVARHRRSVTPSQGSSNESSSPSHIHYHSFSPVRSSPVIRRPLDQSCKGRIRSSSSDGSPIRQVRNQVMHGSHLDSLRGLGKHRQHDDSSDSSEQQNENYSARDSEDHIYKCEERRSIRSSSANRHDDSTSKGHGKYRSYSERASTNQTSRLQGHPDSSEIRNKDQERMRERNSGKGVHSEISDQMSPLMDKGSLQGQKGKFFPLEDKKSENKNHARSDITRDKDMTSNVSEPLGKVDNQQDGASDTASEESEKHKYKQKERRKHKRLDRHEMDSSSESYDSEAEKRKEAKRRRKEEKKLRKEERRRRKEERRRSKKERRAEKLKVKRRGTNNSPFDNENHPSDVDSSDGEQGNKKKFHGLNEEPEKERKKREIELRMKALESFKAKKGAK